MSRKQKKSAEEKVKIIRQYQQGEISISQAAELGEVDFETAKEWIRNYESEGVSAFLPHKNKAYNPEIKRSAVHLYKILILFHCPLDGERFIYKSCLFLRLFETDQIYHIGCVADVSQRSFLNGCIERIFCREFAHDKNIPNFYALLIAILLE